MSENRTFEWTERSKSERLLTERSIVRISALFGYRTFGFRTFTVFSMPGRQLLTLVWRPVIGRVKRSTSNGKLSWLWSVGNTPGCWETEALTDRVIGWVQVCKRFRGKLTFVGIQFILEFPNQGSVQNAKKVCNKDMVCSDMVCSGMQWMCNNPN